MSNNTAEVLARGMQCLAENLGDIETEVFLSTLMRERFDYTKWQREYFADTDLETFNKEAAEATKDHPWK